MTHMTICKELAREVQLGSCSIHPNRQLTDAQGQITLVKAYNPYGVVTQSAGAGKSSYGYTSEYQDSYNDLLWGLKAILGHRHVVKYARTRDSTAAKEYQAAITHENSLLA